MQFNVNHPALYLLSGIIVLAVLAQSLFFLRKAWKRGREIGMPMDKLKRIAIGTAVFTAAPALAIVISVISLSKKLGIPLPWMRLSVVGAITYETPAAANALSAMGLDRARLTELTATQYVTVASVMTMGIMVGIWLVPVVGKKLIGGMINLEKRDKKWGEIFSASLFLGMISAFLGYVFSGFSGVFRGETAGLVPPLVMLVSAAVMVLCGAALKNRGWRWMNDYALPISLTRPGWAEEVPRMKKELSYIDSVHRAGRIWNLSVMVLLMLFPAAVSALFDAAIDWRGFTLGMIATAPMYWAVGLIETFTYVPMLGAGGSYLAFVTGNITNLKAPAALNALELAGADVKTEEGEIVSTVAIAVSSIVTTLIIVLGVVLITPLTPILNAPALAPAFDQILPALFGALGVVYISRNWKIAVAPVTLMLILFIAVPSLGSMVSIMVPVGVLFTLAVSRILYKKNLL